jgi:hypothetical protein
MIVAWSLPTGPRSLWQPELSRRPRRCVHYYYGNSASTYLQMSAGDVPLLVTDKALVGAPGLM